MQSLKQDRTVRLEVCKEFRPKCDTLTRVQGWRELDFRGTDEVEVEEDLEEVMDGSYVTIAGGQDIMPIIV